MSYRFMRSILFFDLPTITLKDKKEYRCFVKEIKKMGFYMLQESVYVKMSIDRQAQLFLLQKVKKIAPKRGNIIVLTITEKQFSGMNVISGDFETDIISNDERIVFL